MARLTFALAYVMLLVGLSLVPFVWPPQREPQHADAVIILSGDHGERRPRALGLLERGVAPRLVFVGTQDNGDEDQLCRQGWRGVETICLRPDPDDTRAEAQAVGRLASERAWKRVIVVTSSHHVVRSALWFHRCVDGHVWVVGERLRLPRRQVARQTIREWLATGYVFLTTRGCR